MYARNLNHKPICLWLGFKLCFQIIQVDVFFLCKQSIVVPSIRKRREHDWNIIFFVGKNYVFPYIPWFSVKKWILAFHSIYEYWSKHRLWLLCILLLKAGVSWLLKISRLFFSPFVYLQRSSFFQASASVRIPNQLEWKHSDAYKYIEHRMPIPNFNQISSFNHE